MNKKEGIEFMNETTDAVEVGTTIGFCNSDGTTTEFQKEDYEIFCYLSKLKSKKAKNLADMLWKRNTYCWMHIDLKED